MREIRIIHMQRSGGHAIANWIVHQCGGNAFFVNDVCNPTVVDVMRNRKPHVPREAEAIVYTVEDQPLQGIPARLSEAARFLPILSDPSPIVVIVLRDVFNMIASRWAYKRTSGGCQLGNVNHRVIETWNQYATVFFYAQHGIGSRMGIECLPASYNAWCQSAAYRCLLWQTLSSPAFGLQGEFTDAGRQEVTTWGCGSSFDGMEWNGMADRMDTSHRYQRVPVEIFECVDPRAALLTEAIFGLRIKLPDKEIEDASQD